MASTMTEVGDIQLQLTTHLSTQKGWKAELAWLVVYPHKWSPVRTGKVRRSKTAKTDILTVPRVGFEFTTCWSQVQRSTHCTTACTPLNSYYAGKPKDVLRRHDIPIRWTAALTTTKLWKLAVALNELPPVLLVDCLAKMFFLVILLRWEEKFSSTIVVL